ncbi:hypothetical protein L0U85_07375 [Glycomyces sp. L485]|uniref:hypothetical protein n=1 Tax=Glycomyces sp. L485 TaxID=2909235 RepID=UPI001F4BB60D|nr:hypothetical protein [Glycomyces sp. L485]MCH7230671.1 hypothetical protein [Glycomyces sp. L485]
MTLGAASDNGPYPSLTSQIQLELFADYHQIHLLDENTEADFGDLWTATAMQNSVAVGADALAIGTEVNVTVAVTVELHTRAPGLDADQFDNVVEASVKAASGRLVVLGCTDYFPEAHRIPVEPGWVRVRTSRWNLRKAAQAAHLSDDNGETMERLRIQVWPGPRRQLAVIKRWKG